MKKKSITLRAEFSNQTEHDVEFIFPEDEYDQFIDGIQKALVDPVRSWIKCPVSEKNTNITFLNVNNITKVEIHDTTHLHESINYGN